MDVVRKGISLLASGWFHTRLVEHNGFEMAPTRVPNMWWRMLLHTTMAWLELWLVAVGLGLG